MSNIFTLNSSSDKELGDLYQTAFAELKDFFQLNWEHSLPSMYVVQGREGVNAWQGEENTNMSGWTYGSHQFYVLDQATYRNEKGAHFKEEDYFRLIKHEMAHCFYQILSNGNTKPIWLWEGFAIYASGQNLNGSKPILFDKFLNSANSHQYGVYEEAGHVVELLDKTKGRNVLLEFLRNLGQEPEGLTDLLAEYYGLELNFESFNELLKDANS